jgi:arylsulfatase A-like enzyme
MPPRVCRSPVGLQDVMPTILDAAGLDVPETCTGLSLLPLARGEAESVREAIHGEHYGDYKFEWSHQYLTDGRWKYIWFAQTGREQLFDLNSDPCELRDLALAPDAEALLAPWRRRLIEVLRHRPEGFTNGEQLIPGRPQHRLLPGYAPDRAFPFL